MMSHVNDDDLKVYVQKAPQGHASQFNNMLFTHIDQMGWSGMKTKEV